MGRENNILKPFKIYALAFLLSAIANFILLIFLCSLINFDSKSAILIQVFGTFGYFIKAMLFYLMYLFLFNTDIRESYAYRTTILLSPFFLFLLWYGFVILFQIEAFFTDISFGYLYHFPHFLVQLFTALVTCITTTIVVNIKSRKLMQNS